MSAVLCDFFLFLFSFYIKIWAKQKTRVDVSAVLRTVIELVDTWEASLLRQNKLGGHFAFTFLYFHTTCFVAVNQSSVESLLLYTLYIISYYLIQ